ncbi:Protein of unknown function [Pyronema omphalodes CBS 100304]|uniref:Uncharacterized protein n=1 Tax=Pyronema omphalodes (strain CBS 100304) TaxID=1076935 RepID=U4LJ15_PYROM|nr:Protein of unknown function [Pyronema omphalodes CBS 100304]
MAPSLHTPSDEVWCRRSALRLAFGSQAPASCFASGVALVGRSLRRQRARLQCDANRCESTKRESMRINENQRKAAKNTQHQNEQIPM